MVKRALISMTHVVGLRKTKRMITSRVIMTATLEEHQASQPAQIGNDPAQYEPTQCLSPVLFYPVQFPVNHAS